jgi:cobalamin biosynthesis Mg chelatase CobN
LREIARISVVMRWPRGPWKPASQSGEPEDEGLDPAVDHHRHFHVEHGDVETESASSEHWPVLPVEEAVHVEDPAADQSGSGSGEATSSSESEDGHRGGGWRRSGRERRRRRRGRRSPLSGLPVRSFVGAAAAVLLALVAVVASWRRRRRQPAPGS